MLTIRSRFYKKGDMVFISHLDLARVFERAVRRAELPVSFTQGFNPRPIIAFASALGVGVASGGEYVDIQISENIDVDAFMKKMNYVLPEGLKIIKSIAIGNKEKSLMSVVDSSSYLIKIKLDKILQNEYLEECIKNFLNLDSIIDLKKKKKKPNEKHKKTQFQEINIRPLIKSISLFSLNEYEAIFKMHLTAGNIGNLKPEIVVKKLSEIFELPIDQEETRVERLDLFKEEQGKYSTPLCNLDIIE